MTEVNQGKLALHTAETDLDLLRRYIDADDADAFAVLVRRHTSLVFYTCLRVLNDRARAEDAAQETFHRLMKHPEKVSHSLAAWLHRVATRLSIDVLRSESARRKRERVYQERLDRRRHDHREWSEVSAQIDEALSQLNDDDRTLLVEHFLHGRSQAEMSREAGVSKATMCRRVEAAMRALRQRIELPSEKSAAIGTAALVTVLSRDAAAAAPATLTAELGKMAMVSGTATSASSGATVTLGIGGVNVPPLVALGGLLGAVALVIAMLIGVIWLINLAGSRPVSPQEGDATPAPHGEVAPPPANSTLIYFP